MTTLASLFTKIGFEVDESSLSVVDKQLQHLESRIKGMANHFKDFSNTPAIKAAANLANAEAKKIAAEARLANSQLTQQSKVLASETKQLASKAQIVKQELGLETAKQKTQQMGLNLANTKVKQELGLEAAKQKTQQLGLNLENTKAKTAQVYAKVNAQSIAQKAKVSYAADMAALKELTDSGGKLRRLQFDEQRMSQNLVYTKRKNELANQKSERDLLNFKRRETTKAFTIAADHARINARNALVNSQMAARQLANNIRNSNIISNRDRTTQPKSNSPSGGAIEPLFTMENFRTAAMIEGARRFISKAFTVGNFQTSQMPQYEFLTGSKEEAGQQVEYVNKLVDKLKLNLVDTNQAYVQFLGATQSTIGNEKTQEIFTNLQSFGVMMGASGDQLKRGTKAVQQMLSKQKLSAEELECRLAA